MVGLVRTAPILRLHLVPARIRLRVVCGSVSRSGSEGRIQQPWPHPGVGVPCPHAVRVGKLTTSRKPPMTGCGPLSAPDTVCNPRQREADMRGAACGSRRYTPRLTTAHEI
eukprot:2065772-Rhodomonas_salina.1